MRKTAVFALYVSMILLFLTFGCADQQTASVSLSTPKNGSSVADLAPTFAWAGPSGASYRLMVAEDNNFQKVVLDANNLTEDVYVVANDLLEANQHYFWKVLAVSAKGGSVWSAPWQFKTPNVMPDGVGKIRVSAKLDGKAWSGDLRYNLDGPFSDTDGSVPWDFNEVPVGTYTVTYIDGGPSGVAMTGVTPAPTYELEEHGGIHFVFNFATQTNSTIKINATLDGQPWSGNVRVAVKGPYAETVKLLPETLTNLPAGEYTLAYKDGGPAGATLKSISPDVVQDVSTSGTITYTLNFTTERSASLTVGAHLDGGNWSGPVQYSISGPVSGNYDSVPIELKDIPAGQYTITYRSGGPSGAALNEIHPSETITVGSGRTGRFALNYSTVSQSGSVEVRATLNGQPWSGSVDYRVSGAMDVGDFQVPRVYTSAPAGKYTVTYKGGGPDNATLAEISPASTQTLAQGKKVVFTLNFVEKTSYGTIYINAVLDGKPWETAMGSGAISYSLSGPTNLADSSIPNSFASLPTGSYTLNYNSGGPTGAALTGISPSPNQTLKAGSAVTYTLNFTSQQKGTVNIKATINGEPWKGDVEYVVYGPYVESGSRVPRSLSNAPSGEYSIDYVSGGPPQSRFVGIDASANFLQPGGKLTFIIDFEFIGMPEPMPGPLLDEDE